jgi:putative membrane protein
MASESEERTELAEERTQWADKRTFLAQERTFAGWIRTGLTSMAVGFGIIELMRDVEPGWLVLAMGLTFLAVGGVIIGIAYISYRKITLQMDESDQPEMALSKWWMLIVAFGLIACAIAGVIVVVV